jgi:hypothetical protein
MSVSLPRECEMQKVFVLEPEGELTTGAAIFYGHARSTFPCWQPFPPSRRRCYADICSLKEISSSRFVLDEAQG